MRKKNEIATAHNILFFSHPNCKVNLFLMVPTAAYHLLFLYLGLYALNSKDLHALVQYCLLLDQHQKATQQHQLFFSFLFRARLRFGCSLLLWMKDRWWNSEAQA
jgi:hypothetical protein